MTQMGKAAVVATLAAVGVVSASASLAGLQANTGRLYQILRRRAARQAAENAKGAVTCGETLNTGFRIMTFSTGLRAAVWYPTTAAETPYEYPGRFDTTVALNGPVASCGARLPLVVFSHGFGGCSIQSVFLTEALAQAGYIVVAPDHKDAMCKVDQPRKFDLLARANAPTKQHNYTDANYRDRHDDIEVALNEILRNPEFGPRIDPERIAGIGHSLGAYTILGMLGAWPSWKDDRIKAGILLSPFLTPYLANGGLRLVHVPLMYQGGTRDFAITPDVKKPGGAYDVSNSPKYYVEIRGAGHLDWSNMACLFRKHVATCAADSEKPRLIDSYSIAFLDRYLKGRQRPELDRSNAELSDMRHADR